MNDDATLKFEVPAIFCGLSRLHFTPKLTLINLNLLKERSYRAMLEIFNNQTSAKKKYNWPKGTRSANELNDANSNERLVTGLSPVHSQSFSVALNLYF